MRAAPRFFLGLFAAAAASLGVTASASAALSLGPVDLGATVQNVVKLNVLGTCGDQDTSAVFRPWGDFSQYVLAPNGDFAATGDWDLDGDAQLVTARVAARQRPRAVPRRRRRGRVADHLPERRASDDPPVRPQHGRRRLEAAGHRADARQQRHVHRGRPSRR